jgi:hypothetical protein
MCALKGIQNLLIVTHSLPTESLGPLLAVLKVLMFHGLPGCPTVIPLSLYPTPLAQFDPAAAKAEAAIAPKKTPSTKKGRKNKSRKKKQQQEDEMEEEEPEYKMDAHTDDVYALSWSKVSSSDSEYSDTEGGAQASRTKSLHSKVRLCAFCCFHALVKVAMNTLNVIERIALCDSGNGEESYVRILDKLHPCCSWRSCYG